MTDRISTVESTPLHDGSEDDSDADANNDDERTQDFPEGVDMYKGSH